MQPLEEAVRQIEDVFSLPQVVIQVVDVVSNPNSTGGDLKMVVETDPFKITFVKIRDGD